MEIGKIVTSASHISYVCRIHGRGEVEQEPSPSDYAFGRFVRVQLPPSAQASGGTRIPLGSPPKSAAISVVGVICDTQLVNPAFGTVGPCLSSEQQLEIFSPDTLSEQATLVSILLLGMCGVHRAGTPPTHGVPALSLAQGSPVETMTEEEIRAFHSFADQPGEPTSLHLGYVPHLLAQPNHLLPLVVLNLIDQLERLFPQQTALLAIMKRNFAWKLKVQTAG